jgi:hypothetical protein
MRQKGKRPDKYILHQKRGRSRKGVVVFMNVEKIAWPQHIALENGSWLTLRPAMPEDGLRLLG